jgi:hypothetical protein
MHLAPTAEPEADLPPAGIAIDPAREDAWWSERFRREAYYRGELDYEDYAPAYCVGYVGYAQYGGSYQDAERSLWANWARIKGDSRLEMHEAAQAMRAAWQRVEQAAALQWASPVRAGQAAAERFAPAPVPGSTAELPVGPPLVAS